MFDQPEPVIDAFRSNIPKDFLSDSLTCLFESYQDAFETCHGQLAETEVHDVVAAYRRALIETHIRVVAHRYQTITIRVEPNARKTSYFSLLSSGVVDLTLAKSGSSNCMPRRARYRSNLFERSQASLFAAERAKTGSRLYAVLLHGSWRRKQLTEETSPFIKFPAFARMVFPDKDGQILTGIDLFRECRHVVVQFMPAVEQVETAMPTPLRKRKTVGE